MRKRGSAMIIILLMVLATAFIVSVAATFGRQSNDIEFRYERDAKVQCAWDAAVSQADANEAAGSFSSFPATFALNLNGVTGTINVADNSGSMANSLLVTSTLTAADGKTYGESSIIAKTTTATPFYFAVFSNHAFTDTHQFVTGGSGSNGDVFANGNISITGGGTSTVNGNISSTGLVTLSGTTVTGSQYASQTAITFTTPPSNGYYVNQTATSSSGTLSGYTFGSVSAGSQYPILYESAASVNVSGSFTGTGTVYFNGNVTVSGAMSYGNGSSHVAFIVNGNLTTNGNALVGYWYVNGTTTTSGSSLSNTKGGLITNNFSPGTSTAITLDPTVKNSVATGNELSLPGYTWTTTDSLVGTYIGTYTVSGAGDSGTMNFTVTSSGAVSGTIVDGILGSGTLSATLLSNGTFSGTITISGNSYPSTGTLTLSGKSLTGTLTAVVSGNDYAMICNLTQQ